MAQRTQTRPTLASPRILLRSGDPAIVCFDAPLVARAAADVGPVPRKSPTPEGERFTALGFRQTDKSAKAGGKANTNGFRFRNESMRALARSFRDQPFLTGHDRGDVRSRGGTIVDAYVEQLAASAELAILYDINATAAWAKEGLANGTIDRFSIGASRGQGEVTCTVHGAPVFVECFCCPGEMVEHEGQEVIAEWEYEDPIGVELSAVNDPAVDGTFVVAASSGYEPHIADAAALARALAQVCGRTHPRLDQLAAGGWQTGGFPRGGSRLTMAVHPPEKQMDPRERMALALGLLATATWDEISAKQAQVSAEANVARAQLAENTRELEASRVREQAAAAASDAAHVDSEIARLRIARQVSEEVVAELRTTAAAGRGAFDASLRLVERSAPPASPAAPAVGSPRAVLQSDALAARTDPTTISAAMPTEPDAFEQHGANPELGKLLRACRITPDDVRKHGPRAIAIVHNLGDLVAATAQRGE